MRRIRLVAFAAVLAAFAFGSTAVAKPPDVNSSKLREAVTVDGIVGHQRALQDIANANGGTRYTKTSGYDASVAYVRDTMQKAGWNVSISQFDMPDWKETAPPVLEQIAPTPKTYVHGSAADDDSAAVDFIAFEFSPTKDVPSAPVVPTNDIVIPSPAANSNTSGCDASDFPAATRGAVSLIQRGTCSFTQKLANAQAAGAVGIILFNEGDSDGRMNAGFRSGPTDLAIPAVFSSFAVGNELYEAFKNNQSPTVHLQTNGVAVEHLYPQVIAETPRGDPNKVVLAGAHLD